MKITSRCLNSSNELSTQAIIKLRTLHVEQIYRLFRNATKR